MKDSLVWSTSYLAAVLGACPLIWGFVWPRQISDRNLATRCAAQKPQMIFPGGGIFFYWQAGVVCYLREQGYDLSLCKFSGASAGALTSTLAAADVDFYEATDLALALAAKAGVWDRPLGLQGIWGPMIEQWLGTLLPESISSVEGRLLLLVTPVPSLGKTQVSKFKSKEDLIRCNMASVHLPWFLDGKLTSEFRGQAYIDGSFRSTWEDYRCQNKGQEGSVLFVDWKKDPSMASQGLLSFIETLSSDGIWDLVDRGKRYARIMEAQGEFQELPRLS